MSPIRRRHFRIRVATRGAPEVEGHVDFILAASSEAGDPEEVEGWLNQIPVASGSLVHPLDGATVVRPTNFRALDRDGSLIRAFTRTILGGEGLLIPRLSVSRWDGIGRLCDFQYREWWSAEWVTYGTGRVSGLDEGEGPPLFRGQVSDESWVGRKSGLFDVPSTVQIWPMGPKGWWSGFPPAHTATAELVDQSGDLYRLRVTSGPLSRWRGRKILPMHAEWMKGDLIPADERVFDGSAERGNFEHLRLHLRESDAPQPTDVSVDLEPSEHTTVEYEAAAPAEVPAWGDLYRFRWEALHGGGVSQWSADWDFYVFRQADGFWSFVERKTAHASASFTTLTAWVEIPDLQEGDLFGIASVTLETWDALDVAWSEEPPSEALGQDYEIISFGSLGSGPSPSSAAVLGSIEEPEIINAETVHEEYRIHVWVRSPDGAPPATSEGYLHAPTAPPDPRHPLLIGVSDSAEKGLVGPGGEPWHPWGTLEHERGFLHPAEITRRYFEWRGQRYNLTALESILADKSFHAVTPRLTGVPADPEKMMQSRVWGPSQIVVLKDAQGRRKPKDIRPPSEDHELAGLPVINRRNARAHRWKLVGREQMNSVVYRALRLLEPGERIQAAPGGRVATQVRNFPQQAEAFDNFIAEEILLPPEEPPDVDDVGRRQREFDVRAFLADPHTRPARVEALEEADICLPFLEEERQLQSAFLLGMYQDGPQLFDGKISRTLAETLEEGDYVIADAEELKLANPGTRARLGGILALVLSMTKNPPDVDVEYIAYRPVELPGQEEFDGTAVIWVMAGNKFSTAEYIIVEDPEDFFDPDTDTEVTGGQTIGGEGGDEDVSFVIGAQVLAGVLLVIAWMDAGEARIFRSHDGGQSWEDPLLDPTSDWGSGWMPQSGAFGAGGELLVVADDSAELSWSTDLGESWTTPVEPLLGESMFPDGFDPVRVGSNGQVAVTVFHSGGDTVILRSTGAPDITGWEASIDAADLAVGQFEMGLAFGNGLWIAANESSGDCVHRCLSATLEPAGWEEDGRTVVSSAFQSDVFEGEASFSNSFNPGAVKYLPRAGGGGRWWLLRARHALVFSDDDGLTWSKALCDHADPNGHETIHPFLDWRAQEGGNDFQNLPRIWDIQQHPTDLDRIVALGQTYAQAGITNTRAVYSISTDGGDTWGPIRELPIQDLRAQKIFFFEGAS